MREQPHNTEGQDGYSARMSSLCDHGDSVKVSIAGRDVMGLWEPGYRFASGAQQQRRSHPMEPEPVRAEGFH